MGTMMGLRSDYTSVALNVPIILILVSNYHFPFKGTRPSGKLPNFKSGAMTIRTW